MLNYRIFSVFWNQHAQGCPEGFNRKYFQYIYLVDIWGWVRYIQPE